MFMFVACVLSKFLGQVRLARGEVEERIERRVTFERKFNDGDAPLSFSVER